MEVFQVLIKRDSGVVAPIDVQNPPHPLPVDFSGKRALVEIKTWLRLQSLLGTITPCLRMLRTQEKGVPVEIRALLRHQSLQETTTPWHSSQEKRA